MSAQQRAESQPASRPPEGCPMEVGRFYNITEVRAGYLTPSRPRWWPVLGQAHSDLEYIGFLRRHLHLDKRFLADALVKEILGKYAGYDQPPPDPGLAIITTAAPLNWSQADPRNYRGVLAETCLDEGRHTFLGIPLERLPDPEFTVDTYVRTVRRRMRRQYGEFREDMKWLPGLRAAFREQTLGPRMICPHQGADLSGLPPDENGTITCPLHGLRWCSRTGKAEP